jgi:hypothetical protein
VQGHGKPPGANVLAEGEKGAMLPEIIDRRLRALIDLDLFHARIALDVEN